MTTKPEPTLNDLLWAIAKAETACHFHAEVDGFELRCIKGKVSVSGQVHYPCKVCNGTGRVPRFPELRTTCQRHVLDNHQVPLLRPEYMDCHGLGFVPLEGGWEGLATWIRVLGEAFDRFDIWSKECLFYEDALWEGDILGAFNAATEALGIEVAR